MLLIDEGTSPNCSRRSATHYPAGRRRAGVLISLAVLLLLACTGPARSDPARAAPASIVHTPLARLPLSFEMNRGQVDRRVAFLARGPGYTLLLTHSGMLLSPQAPADQGQTANSSLPVALQLRFSGATPHPRIVGLQREPGIVNYFLGNNPHAWHTDIPTYAQVEYAGLYPGIDLRFYVHTSRLEYDWLLHPGANPGRIHLVATGMRRAWLDRKGSLLLDTAFGQLAQPQPVVTQQGPHGWSTIKTQYILRGNIIGFRLAKHNTAAPIRIDPTIVYSTYLGGIGGNNSYGVTVDAQGNIYFCGVASQDGLPTVFAHGFHGGQNDAFVGELTASGRAVKFISYLGGYGDERANSIALDALDNVFVTGTTSSPNFPHTASALQQSFAGGGSDVFVTKLNGGGDTMLYSTFFGGSAADAASAIAVNGADEAWVAGFTSSPDFPPPASTWNDTYGGAVEDGFVAKLGAAGGQLLYFTYIGAAARTDTTVNAMALDSTGQVYITGETNAPGLPTTLNAFQSKKSDSGDAFVVKLSTSGALLYLTYLGGSGNDIAWSIAVDPTGSAYVAGMTSSTDFPRGVGAQASYHGGQYDAFLAKLAPEGSALEYGTYIGGSGADIAYGVTIDSTRAIYIVGSTNSPRGGSIEGQFAGGSSDAFLARVNATGKATDSLYIGGSAADQARGAAVGPADNLYIVGVTASSNFPVRGQSIEPKLQGLGATFVMIVNPRTAPPTPTPTSSPTPPPTATSPPPPTLKCGQLAILDAAGHRLNQVKGGERVKPTLTCTLRHARGALSGALNWSDSFLVGGRTIPGINGGNPHFQWTNGQHTLSFTYTVPSEPPNFTEVTITEYIKTSRFTRTRSKTVNFVH